MYKRSTRWAAAALAAEIEIADATFPGDIPALLVPPSRATDHHLLGCMNARHGTELKRRPGEAGHAIGEEVVAKCHHAEVGPMTMFCLASPPHYWMQTAV